MSAIAILALRKCGESLGTARIIPSAASTSPRANARSLLATATRTCARVAPAPSIKPRPFDAPTATTCLILLHLTGPPVPITARMHSTLHNRLSI
eukprot:5413505-Pyramimonas_sp.AAC.1